MSRQTFELEQLLLGELPEPRASALREELLINSALAAEYQALAASNAQTLSQFPPRVVAVEVERRAAGQKKHASRAWRLVIPALASLAIIAVATRSSTDTHDGDGVRTKGLQPALHIYRDRSGTVEELKEGAIARPGDQVQLRYVSAGSPWGVLVSIDGRGGVTLHFPLEKGGAPKLESAPVTLPRALELDDAPLFERFIFVTCDTRPDVEKVVLSAGALAKQNGARVDPLVLEPGCAHQTSFVLGKESR